MTVARLDDALFLLSAVPIIAFGAGITFHPSLAGLPLAARAAMAYGAGALALTMEAIAFTLVGIPWGYVSLGLPLLLGSAGLGLYWKGRPIRRLDAERGKASGLPLAICVVAAVSLALLLVSSRAVSVDFLLFYGVKALRFALSRGVDLELFRNPYFYHGVPQYPPLMSIVESWGVLLAGRLPWRAAPLISWIWFAATVVLVSALLRQRLPARAAAAVTAFWTAVIALSFAVSSFGGNGDAPLVFYETVAGLFLLVETPTSDANRWFAAIALAGAAMTKQEGILAAFLLAAGALARDFFEARRHPIVRAVPLLLIPVAALLFWLAFQRFAGITVGFHLQTETAKISIRRLPAVLKECLRELGAGSAGLGWILPGVFLMISGRRLLVSLPALFVTAGVLGALVATYLGGSPVDLHVLVFNTFSRAVQPALSLWVLGAGVAWFSTLDRPIRRHRPPIDK